MAPRRRKPVFAPRGIGALAGTIAEIMTPGKLYDVLQRLHESSLTNLLRGGSSRDSALSRAKYPNAQMLSPKEAYDRAKRGQLRRNLRILSLSLSRSPEALADIQGLPADQLRLIRMQRFTALMLADSK